MEIKRLRFLKELGVGRHLKAGGRAPGRVKEGCFERQEEKKNARLENGERGPIWQINETNGKKLGSFLDPKVNEKKRKIQHGKQSSHEKWNSE